MSNDTITKIRDAEDRASQIIADARAEAEAIVSTAKNNVSDKIESANLLCVKISKDEQVKAAAQSAEIMEKKTDAARVEAKKTVSIADKNMDNAIGIIIREIFEKWQ
ncbi:MAG: hypothetical protein E7575_01400 [Ruminococcaceae bacterium]|nr:hypothetical protein [Oscillospiraceae bacterium]